MNQIEHYENFPVASLLVPKRLRPDVIAIYRFARAADDIADEGDAAPEARLETLQKWQNDLKTLFKLPESAPQVSLLIPEISQLAPTIARHHLPAAQFQALLSAFSQDIVQKRYADDAALLDYCARSANPVGRLMLGLMKIDAPQALAESDAICTALQLINFLQDVEIDWRKERVYIAQTTLTQFGVTVEMIGANDTGAAWCALMAARVGHARALMLKGAPLIKKLRGRMRWEIAFTVAGGLRILQKIEHVNYDVFRLRPTLSWRDGPALLSKAIALNL